jgi:uncharacterized tellurite resistance protein B-like protein
MSPNQRANYLAWLASGRTAQLEDIGYVFVFFYGLERRALVDGQDLYPVLCEVARLLERYPASHSFQSYGRSFLAYALAKNGLQNLSENWFQHLVEKPGLLTTQEGLAVTLGWLALQERPLPAPWARRIASLDERSQQSVVVERVRAQFDELFDHKFAARFEGGLLLRCAKRDHACVYQPGSPSLIQLRNRSGVLTPVRIPNVQGITTQFKPLIDLWNECIDELRPLSRQVGKGIAVTSRAAYDALPEALKLATEHPDATRWQEVAARHRRESGPAIVPIRELAPLYREERGEIEPSGAGVYSAAALLLELGFAMAAADGQIDVAEITHVTQFIEGQFELAAAQIRRLQALQRVFAERPPALSGVGNRLQALMTVEQREQLATFLIGVAAANGTIDRAEISLLRKAARALGLAADCLDGLIAELVWTSDEPVEVQRGSSSRAGEIIPPRRVSEVAASGHIELNEELLRSIMLETQHVARMLTAAMGEPDETSEAALTSEAPRMEAATLATNVTPSEAEPSMQESQTETTAPQAHYGLGGLDSRYHQLVTDLLESECWTTSEFQALVRRHGLFPAGAVDVVNEWAEEQLGDLLIEDGDSFFI